MADENKSREVIGTGMTDHGQYYVEYSDGTREAAISGGELRVRAGDDDKLSDISISVTADVAEALTGFKALQRELRETTKAVRELENAYEDLALALEYKDAR